MTPKRLKTLNTACYTKTTNDREKRNAFDWMDNNVAMECRTEVTTNFEIKLTVKERNASAWMGNKVATKMALELHPFFTLKPSDYFRLIMVIKWQ